jgi:hypothetical protein
LKSDEQQKMSRTEVVSPFFDIQLENSVGKDIFLLGGGSGDPQILSFFRGRRPAALPEDIDSSIPDLNPLAAIRLGKGGNQAIRADLPFFDSVQPSVDEPEKVDESVGAEIIGPFLDVRAGYPSYLSFQPAPVNNYLLLPIFHKKRISAFFEDFDLPIPDIHQLIAATEGEGLGGHEKQKDYRPTYDFLHDHFLPISCNPIFV